MHCETKAYEIVVTPVFGYRCAITKCVSGSGNERVLSSVWEDAPQ